MDSQLQLQPPPEAFIKPLLEVREHYAREVTRCEDLLKQALDNLHHVEALLGAWTMSIDATSSSSAQIQTISEPLSDAPNAQQSLFTDDSITQLSLIDEQTDIEQTDSSSVEQTTSQFTTNTDQQQPEPDDSTHSETSSFPYSDIPMLPEYQHLTRTEAIQKLLQEYVGTVCHIDFIVRSLYGELEPHRFKIVKDRVRSTLTYGVEANRWYAEPDHVGCYTLDISLIRPDYVSKPKSQTKKRSPQPPQPQTLVVPMLSEYKGQFLIDALTYLLEENPGKVFNVAEVIQAIYGELNAEQLREVKPKVLNELSRGHRIGRFTRVPEQIGLYTWDAKLLQQTRPA